MKSMTQEILYHITSPKASRGWFISSSLHGLSIIICSLIAMCNKVSCVIQICTNTITVSSNDICLCLHNNVRSTKTIIILTITVT